MKNLTDMVSLHIGRSTDYNYQKLSDFIKWRTLNPVRGIIEWMPYLIDAAHNVVSYALIDEGK